MLRFSLALILALISALGIAWAIFVVLARLRGADVSLSPFNSSARSLSSSDIYDLIRSTITATGLAAGVFAAVYAYRKQRVEEAAGKRADAQHLSDRYKSAADQLGNDKAAVRLAGVYAMARLADDWLDQRQTCIDVLCAYLRMHTEGEVLSNAEREVRQTIILIVQEHLDLKHSSTWRGYDLNFRGALFDTDFYLPDGIGSGFCDLSKAIFNKAQVVLETSPDGSLGDLDLEGATFENSSLILRGRFTKGLLNLAEAQLTAESRFDFSSTYIDGLHVNFSGCRFVGGTAYFSGTRFLSGGVKFDRAEFDEGELHFNHAKFTRGVVDFGYAKYGNARLVFEDAEGDKPDGLPRHLWNSVAPKK